MFNNINNSKKISVIIPTLQKNKKVLNNLLKTLDCDNAVGEIIIIDNKCKGLETSENKVRIVIPETNLYVNPSWNLGVKEAKYEIVALFNDDLAIPENFCSDVVNQIKPEMGVIGINSEDWMVCFDEITHNPNNTNPVVEKAEYRSAYFGSIMFFFKEKYLSIPEDIKIVYGDDWIVNHNKNNIYKISNQIIYHIGSLSSGEKKYNPISAQDAKIYKKITVKWYHRIFSFEKIWDGFKLRILGITLKFINKKRRSFRNG